MASHSRTIASHLPAPETFRRVRRAVDELGQYAEKQAHEEVLWIHYAWKGRDKPPSFLEVQIIPAESGCSIQMELRNPDLRDHLGLLKVEGRRVAGQIETHLRGAPTPSLFPRRPPPRPITDRSVILAAIAAAAVMAFLGVIAQCAMGV